MNSCHLFDFIIKLYSIFLFIDIGSSKPLAILAANTQKLEDCVLLLNPPLQFPLWCSFSFVRTEWLPFTCVKSQVGTTGHNLGSVKVAPAAAIQEEASCSGSLDTCQGISVVLVKC